MKIMGVDPGTWKTGAGIIEVHGNQYQLLHFEVISIPRETKIEDRLRKIHEGLCRLIEVFKPEVLALENVFFGKDVRALVKIGEARACAMLAASAFGIDVVEYPPARVKQAVSGNGRATKDQIARMMQRLLNMAEIPPSDGADALAVAICHVHARSVLTAREQLEPGKSCRGRSSL